MEKYMLTTEDNPFNPFTQWDDWYFYDLSKGYNTCERLARIAKPGFVLPDEAIFPVFRYICRCKIRTSSRNSSISFCQSAAQTLPE